MPSHLTPNVVCVVCGDTFHVVPARVATAKYCSRACQNVGLRRPDRRNVDTTRTCSQCGKPFTVKPHRAKEAKFCSYQCAYQGREWSNARVSGVSTRTNKTRGYVEVWVPEHPCAHKDGYVSLHRLVVEKEIGRYLSADEVVHHIDGDPSNNEPENLEVMTQSEHARLHLRIRRH